MAAPQLLLQVGEFPKEEARRNRLEGVHKLRQLHLGFRGEKDMDVIQVGFLLDDLHPELFGNTEVYLFQARRNLWCQHFFPVLHTADVVEPK